jgi:transposase
MAITASSAWPVMGLIKSIRLAFCWAHMRREFFRFYTSTKSPLVAVLTGVAAFCAVEVEIRAHSLEHRQLIRQKRSSPIVEMLYEWLHAHVGRAPGTSDLAKAMHCAVRRGAGLIAFVGDGRMLGRERIRCSRAATAGRVIEQLR